MSFEPTHGPTVVAADQTPRAGRREWAGLAVLALACVLYSTDLTVLHLAVPHLSADLQPSSAQLLRIVDIHGFFLAGSLITMGTLGDRIGRRRLLLIGAAASGLASLLAAFSTSAEMLIVGVPPDSAEAARDTLGGAVVAGEGVPDPLAAELLEGARDTFAQGLQLAALTSAVLAVATAVVAAVLLRRVRVSPGAAEGA